MFQKEMFVCAWRRRGRDSGLSNLGRGRRTHGQDARYVQHLLGQHVDGVGRKQRERDKDGGFPHALPPG
jgi:hypothetical protein